MAKKLKLKKKEKPVKKFDGMGSGGTHWHQLATAEQTEMDGGHKHLFVIGGIPVFTDFDGSHSHPVNLVANRTGPEDQRHKHKIKINGSVMMTGEAGAHLHELQGREDGTTFSGLHRHMLVLEDGQEVQSLLPGDLMQSDIRKRVALEIQSVHVSNLLFPEQQEAIQFVEERGFIARDVEALKDGFRFRQLSRDRFVQETLKELELMNGVKATVGVLDKEKMADAEQSLDALKDINPGDQLMKDEQVAALARLRDLYKEMVDDMKTKAERFIPVLNQFIDLSDEFIKNEPFQEFLTEFIDSFNVLQGELSRIDSIDVDAATEKRTGNFEDNVRDIEIVLKNLADIFDGSESFDNFGKLLRYNQLLFKQMILNIPLIREEGDGTPISKVYNDFIDFEKTDSDELENLPLEDLSKLKIKEIDPVQLRESESLNTALGALLKKLKPNGDIQVDLGCGESKPDDYVGIDKTRGTGVDLCYNLNKGIPLPTDSVDKIRAVDFLQHIDSDNREFIVKEAARVLKSDGDFTVEVPSTEGQKAFLPCFKSLWNEEVFKYFTTGNDAEFEMVESSTEKVEDGSSATVKVTLRRKKRNVHRDGESKK